MDPSTRLPSADVFFISVTNSAWGFLEYEVSHYFSFSRIIPADYSPPKCELSFNEQNEGNRHSRGLEAVEKQDLNTNGCPLLAVPWIQSRISLRTTLKCTWKYTKCVWNQMFVFIPQIKNFPQTIYNQQSCKKINIYTSNIFFNGNVKTMWKVKLVVMNIQRIMSWIIDFMDFFMWV